MPQHYNSNPLVGLVGNVSIPPQTKETTKGSIVTFGLAVKTGYDETAGPRWIDVSVWNDGLQQYARQNFHRGAKVAVEGFWTTREVNGRTYEQINAQQVGLVEWGTRTKRLPTPSPTAPAAVASESEW